MRAWIQLVAVVGTVVGGRGIAAEDVVCRISEAAVQKFADVVFPMEVSGTKKIAGAALAGGVPWKATVSKARISVGRDARTFVAHVRAQAAGVTWEGDVQGKLQIDYTAKTNMLTVRVRDAIVPIDAGIIKVDLDVSDDLPVFGFHVAMPEASIPERKKKFRVESAPTIEFEDGAVLVKSDVRFSSP